MSRVTTLYIALGLLVAGTVYLFNSAVRLRNRAREAFSGIDVQLRARRRCGTSRPAQGSGSRGFHLAASRIGRRWMIHPSRIIHRAAANRNCTIASRRRPCAAADRVPG
jgi:hypothetical protein